MEDIMKALLDVVRAQHSATEGSEEKPFDINDIIDMAMNITGRPEEPAEQRELSDTIQKMAESMAPDIFPPKTFEEMDDSERAASAVNMIEERLKNGGSTAATADAASTGTRGSFTARTGAGTAAGTGRDNFCFTAGSRTADI